jgi:hypothetical protein
VSALLDAPPFSPRDDPALLAELTERTRWHIERCPAYARMWPDWRSAERLDELPYVHVSAFKRLALRSDAPDLVRQRTLLSSSTSGGAASRIALDARSSELQARSSAAILAAVLGASARPLVVVDDARNLRQRGEVSARIAAAMSLRPLASAIHFVLEGDPSTGKIAWDKLAAAAGTSPEILAYGFTWILWTQLARAPIPNEAAATLRRTRVRFVHSGGWKKLEASGVDRATFDRALLEAAGAGSTVTDVYGLVEQVGILYPLCEAGFRHAPRWAAVVARDPHTHAALVGEPGQLQLMNPLAWGAPYHSVLTEDVGRVVDGDCPCGRAGLRFELHGRLPNAELRGCANV